MEGTVYRVPRTVDEVFIDFKGRRAGLIKAFTTDLKEFYQQCHPDPEMRTLCLYGFPNETWKVDLPVEEVPPALPEPVVGINIVRDVMDAKDWLSYVLIHSDAWLISVAFFFGVRLRFSKSERRRLFEMINEQPTIFEAVALGVKKPATDESSAPNNGSKNKSSGRMPSRQPEPQSKDEDKSEGDEEEDEQGSTSGDNYANDESGYICSAISVKNGSMENA